MNFFFIKISFDVILGITFHIEILVAKTKFDGYRANSKGTEGRSACKGVGLNPRKGNVERRDIELPNQPLDDVGIVTLNPATPGLFSIKFVRILPNRILAMSVPMLNKVEDWKVRSAK
jgi:hypothetical protein